MGVAASRVSAGMGSGITPASGGVGALGEEGEAAGGGWPLSAGMGSGIAPRGIAPASVP